jgi:hypothetical protein
MDTLDKISSLIIVILAGSLVFLSLDYEGIADSSIKYHAGKYSNNVSAGEIPPETIKKIRDLMAINNIGKTEALIVEMLKKYPFEGEPHMLMGDIMMRKQDPVAGIYSYREAVELNTDYVDRKTPLFQGRKIKISIDEAKDIINNALAKDPDNKDMKQAKKTMYYLLRKLAGSCG